LIGNQAQQSEGVLPYELQQAQGSEGGLRALGQLLSAGGMLAGLSGLTSAPGAASAAPSWGDMPQSLTGIPSASPFMQDFGFTLPTTPWASAYGGLQGIMNPNNFNLTGGF